MTFIRLVGAETLSTADKWATSGITTLLGLGMTFVILAVLIGIIVLLRLLLQQLEKKSPVVKQKILSLFKRRSVKEPVAATVPSEEASFIPAPNAIDENTLAAIRKAVMGFAKKDNNVVIIQSVTRGSCEDVSEQPATPVAVPASAPVASEKPKEAGKGTSVNAPMPGTILKIKGKNGAPIRKNDVMFVLEAMKMENDIVAPCDGIFSVLVDEGTKVNTGDLIAVIQ